MAKNTNTPAPVNMNGLTAAQMKALIDNKKVTAQEVVSFLQAKEAAHGLRFPARELLAELAPPAPAKPGKSKPVVKAEAPAPALDAANILARLGALEVAVSALVERFAPAKPVAPVKVVKVEAKPAPAAAKPVVAAVPTPVVFAPVAPPAKAEVKAAAPVKVAPKRQEPPVTTPIPSEAEMRSALRGCATAQLREEAVASDIEGAETMSKGALIDALVALVLAEEEMIATPVTPAANAPKGKSKPDLRVVKQAEVEF